MKLGIVGLPKVGKTTLFNALTGLSAATSTYAASATPNVGVVKVPDTRLDTLAEMYHPKKYTPATIEFVDVVGLAKGASRGEGLGNGFLQHIRQTDALVHVVRCFENDDLFLEPADAARDADSLTTELILADLEVAERRLERARKNGKGGDKKYKHEEELFAALSEHLSDGKQARFFDFTADDLALVSDGGLLTLKPVIYAANLGEEEYAQRDSNASFLALQEIAGRDGDAVLPVCAALEQDIAVMPPEDQAMFLEELGISQRGIDRLIQCSYELLGYISFLTCGEDEVRAWTITRGTKAQKAAGKIHTDIERGFIRAEVVAFTDLKADGSMTAAKEKGHFRLEGKEYIVQDGDIAHFRFNVSK